MTLLAADDYDNFQQSILTIHPQFHNQAAATFNTKFQTVNAQNKLSKRSVFFLRNSKTRITMRNYGRCVGIMFVEGGMRDDRRLQRMKRKAEKEFI